MSNFEQLSPARGDAGPRFLLWIDGVGGYLVCEGEDWVIGQPVPGSRVDIPILGDLSRRHATIRRDGEGYLIIPHRPIRLAGRPVAGASPLADGALIELGEGVELRFRRPHPLSSSARLDFVSRHRTQPAADAVLLMADNLVLGPSARSHVECPRWSEKLVIFRQDAALFCRRHGHFEIDGSTHHDQGPITRSSRIAGEDFSLSLEQL